MCAYHLAKLIPPLVQKKTISRRYADALVVLRLSEFAELIVSAGGGINPRNGEPRK